MTMQAKTQTADPDVARTVQVLGGDLLPELQVHNALEAHDLLSRGLPSPVLSHLVSSVPFLRGNIEGLIGISLRTLQRREGKSDPLDVEQSSRVWQFAEILGRVEDLMGGREEAEEWLKTPAMALDYRKPIDLLKTHVGREAVEDHLTRLEYGVYT